MAARRVQRRARGRPSHEKVPRSDERLEWQRVDVEVEKPLARHTAVDVGGTMRHVTGGAQLGPEL